MGYQVRITLAGGELSPTHLSLHRYTRLGRAGVLLDCVVPSDLGLPPHMPLLSLQEILRPYGAFWLTAAFCILSVLFTLTFVPETKGRTLEQITSHFEGR